MKTRILSIYNKAKTENKPLLFDSESAALIPAIYDEEGEEIDTNFIAYYLANYAIFDRFVKYQHGKKYYSYITEDFESSLAAFKDEAQTILAVHAPAWASEFAANVKKNKIILTNNTTKTDILGESEEIRTMGARHSETLYGEDTTTANYGATSTTMATGEHNAENHKYETTYDSGTLTETTKDTTKNAAASDTSSSTAHEDSSTREARSDEHDEDQYIDNILRPETTNVSTVIDNAGYFEKLNNIPEFTNLMKKIINTIIVEMGCCYDY